MTKHLLLICYCCYLQALAKGDWQSALEHYTAAIKLDPSNVAARNNRALTYLKLKKYEEAAADCSNVLSSDSSNVKALLRRATAFEGLDFRQTALEDLQQVLKIEPNNADAKSKVAALEKQIESAAATASAAAAVAPQSSS